jgi:hypothetical protein
VGERSIFAQARGRGKDVQVSVARIVLFSTCSRSAGPGGAKIPGAGRHVLVSPPFMVACALHTERLN